MDFEGAIRKLTATIKAKDELTKKLETHPDNSVIKNRIKEFSNTIRFLKEGIGFDKVFGLIKEDDNKEIDGLKDANEALAKECHAYEAKIKELEEEIKKLKEAKPKRKSTKKKVAK